MKMEAKQPNTLSSFIDQPVVSIITTLGFLEMRFIFVRVFILKNANREFLF